MIFLRGYQIFPSYKSKPLIASLSAQRELDKIGADLWLVKRVLEHGYNCAVSRRKPNIIERCIQRKGKELRVVVALVEWEDKALWRVIHVGETAKHR